MRDIDERFVEWKLAFIETHGTEPTAWDAWKYLAQYVDEITG